MPDRPGRPPPQGRRCDRRRPRRRVQKKPIEDADTLGESLGLPVWCEDEAGPFQTVPHPGPSWQPEDRPARRPHEYVRNGAAKIMTLFHPATGTVRVGGAASRTNAVLHPWLREEPTEILAGLPLAVPTPVASKGAWERWQAGLSLPIALPEEPPPPRMPPVLDNLAGHKTPPFVLRLFTQGIMPLYTPLSGSWLNMAESIQRVLKRRALDGQHPASPAEVVAGIEALERGPDALRVGRQAGRAEETRARAASPRRRLRRPDAETPRAGPKDLWPSPTQMNH